MKVERTQRKGGKALAMNFERNLAIFFVIAMFIICSILYICISPATIVYPMLIMPLLFYLILMLPEKNITSPSRFFLVDRKMRASKFRQTYVGTNVGLASSLMFSASLGYWYGVSVMLWGPLTWGIGILLYYKLFPRIIPHLKSDNTLHEFLANRFSTPGKRNVTFRIVTSGVTSIIFWALMSVEIYMATIVLKPIMGKVPAFSIAIAIAVIAFSYSYIAGYAGVVKTDKYQVWLIKLAAVTMCGVVIYVFFYSADEVNIPLELRSPFAMDWLTVLALFIVSLPYQFCTMDMWQRTFAMSAAYDNDSEFSKDIRKHLLISIAEYTLLFWIFMILGIAVRAVQSDMKDPNHLLNEFLTITANNIPMGYVFYGIILLGIVSSIVSTVDSLLNSLTQTFMYDIYSTIINPNLYRRLVRFSRDEEIRFVSISRFFIPLFGLSGIVLVFFVFGIFNFLMNIYALVVVFFPSILYAILSSQKSLSFWGPFCSILSGLIIVLALSITGTFIFKSEIIVLYAPVGGLAISIIALTIGCKLDRVQETG